MKIINRQYQEHPILIDKYLAGKEVEVDAICDENGILIPGIMEHVTGRSSVFLLSFEKMRGSLLFLYKGRKKVYN